MYCNVLCCRYHRSGGGSWIWNSAMSAHTVGLSTKKGFCAAQEFFETPDMIASDIFNKGPLKIKHPPGGIHVSNTTWEYCWRTGPTIKG